MSFDVKNLFPSVSPSEAIQITEQLLIDNQCNSSIRKDIIRSLTVYFNQIFFEFNKVIYIEKDSLAMGNPLSPLMAEIFMASLEKQIKKLPFLRFFKFWYRYVDDVFTCFTGIKRQLNCFFNSLNKLHKNITFTMELENNNSIKVLDLTISKINNRLSYSIFHKPSYTLIWSFTTPPRTLILMN